MKTLDVNRITDYPVCSSPESGICRSPTAGSRRSSISGMSESSLTSEGSLTYDASRRPNKKILKRPHGPRRGSKNRVRWRLPGGDNESDTTSLESYDSSIAGSNIFQRARNGLMESRQNWKEFERCPSPGSTGLTPARRPPGRNQYSMQRRASSPESPIYQSPKHIPTILISPSSSSDSFRRIPSPLYSPPQVTSPSHSPVPPSSAPSADEPGNSPTISGQGAHMHSTPVGKYSGFSSPQYSNPREEGSRSPECRQMNGHDDSSDVFDVSVLRINSSTLSELEASTQDERQRRRLFEFPAESRQRMRKLSSPSSFKSYILPENPLQHCSDSDDYDHLAPVDENQPDGQGLKYGKTVNDSDKRLSGRYRVSDISEVLQHISAPATLPKNGSSTSKGDETPPAIPPKRKNAPHNSKPFVNPPQERSSPTKSTAPVVPPKKRKSAGQINSQVPTTKSPPPAQAPIMSTTARPMPYRIPADREKNGSSGASSQQSHILPEGIQSSALPTLPVNGKDRSSSSTEGVQESQEGLQTSVPPELFKIPVNRERRRKDRCTASKEGVCPRNDEHKAMPPVPEVDREWKRDAMYGRNKPLPPLPEMPTPDTIRKTAAQSDDSIILPPPQFTNASGLKPNPHTSHIRNSSTSSVDSLYSVSNSTLVAEQEDSSTQNPIPQSQKPGNSKELQATSSRFMEDVRVTSAKVHPDSPPVGKSSWHPTDGMKIQDRVVVGAENPDNLPHHATSLGSDSSSDECGGNSVQTTSKPNQTNPITSSKHHLDPQAQAARLNKPPNLPSPRYSKKMSMEMAYAGGNLLKSLHSSRAAPKAVSSSKHRSSSEDTPGQRTTPEGEAQSLGFRRTASSPHQTIRFPPEAVSGHFSSEDQHLLHVLYSGGKPPSMKPIIHDTDKSINAMLAELEPFEGGGEQQTKAQQPCGKCPFLLCHLLSLVCHSDYCIISNYSCQIK